MRDTYGFAVPMVDSMDYDRMARGVLDGSWPKSEVFFVDPLYAYFLAGCYTLFGDGVEPVLVLQLALGALHVGLIYLLASTFLRPSEALFAGVLAATYGVFFFFEALLLKTSLAVLCVTLFLLLLTGARFAAIGWSLIAGLVLGAAVLLRGNLLVLAPIGLVWLAFGPNDAVEHARRLLRPFLFALGLALALAPVTLHNVRAGDFVLTTSNLGANLYTGNGPHNTTGTYIAPPGVRASPVYEQRDFERIAETEEERQLSPSEVSRYWVRRTRAAVAREPARVMSLVGLKTMLLLNAVEVPDNESYAKTRAGVPLLQLPLPCFGALLVLAAASIVLLRFKSEHALMLTVLLAIGATIVVFFVTSRFRLAAVPPLILLAAALPGAVAHGLARGAWSRGLVAAGAALLALFVTTREVYDISGTMLWLNDASIARERGETDAALGFLDQALLEDEKNWRALVMRGQLLSAREEDAHAETAFLLATEVAPQEGEPWLELGAFYARTNRLDDAEAPLTRAMRSETTRVQATVQLADLERRTRRFDEARSRLRALVEEAPDRATVWHVLGLVELDARDLPAARAALERAVALRPDNPRFQESLARVRRIQGE